MIAAALIGVATTTASLRLVRLRPPAVMAVRPVTQSAGR
jgi:hypothetical protein